MSRATVLPSFIQTETPSFLGISGVLIPEPGFVINDLLLVEPLHGSKFSLTVEARVGVSVEDMARRSLRSSAKTFAKKRHPVRKGRGCSTCIGWGDVIRIVVDEWIESGDGYYNWAQLHRWLCSEHQYPYTSDALWICLKRHEWQRLEKLQTQKAGRTK